MSEQAWRELFRFDESDIDKAREILSDLCNRDAELTMRVPPSRDDFDLVFKRVIDFAEEKAKELNQCQD